MLFLQKLKYSTQPSSSMYALFFTIAEWIDFYKAGTRDFVRILPRLYGISFLYGSALPEAS